MNFTPIIEGIAKLIGHNPADIERAIGDKLSNPEKQVPVLHDYLRNAQALSNLDATGAPHFRSISRGVWESSHKYTKGLVDQDPELQGALSALQQASGTPQTPQGMTVTTKTLAPDPTAQSVTTVVAPGKQPSSPRSIRKLTNQQQKDRADAFKEFMLGVENQDQARTDAAMERIATLHEPNPDPAAPREPYQKVLDYAQGLEAKVQEMRQAGVRGDQWNDALRAFRTQSDVQTDKLPSYLRDTVDRYEAWAASQRTPSLAERASDLSHMSQTLMTSWDLSAPGKQGILMSTQPEFWGNLGAMVKSLDRGNYLKSQAEIRANPWYEKGQEAGLHITDPMDKLGPAEEVFQSKLAEKFPGVKASEQAYTTFLNRVRMQMFARHMEAAERLGVPTDDAFAKDLAKWLNSGTGRGSGILSNGLLGRILFAPKLITSRLEAMNPLWYHQMHPYVRNQAIKTNLGAAALVFSLTSLSGLLGAKVTYDFRNSDAGYIKIGNSRYDLTGGFAPYMRLMMRLGSGQSVSPEGKVKQLGALNTPQGMKNRGDLLFRFFRQKESPIASFVHDILTQKDALGRPFDLKQALTSRMIPLFIQDAWKAMQDGGLEGLLKSVPAIGGIGYMDYEPRSQFTVSTHGVQGQVPPEQTEQFQQAMLHADSAAVERALLAGRGKTAAQQKIILRRLVQAYRQKAQAAWIQQNRDAFQQAIRSGETKIPLETPVPEEQQ